MTISFRSTWTFAAEAAAQVWHGTLNQLMLRHKVVLQFILFDQGAGVSPRLLQTALSWVNKVSYLCGGVGVFLIVKGEVKL